MLDISRKLVDELVLEIEGEEQIFPLLLSFDRVLKLFEMWGDEEIPEIMRPLLALQILTGVSFENLTVDEAMEIVRAVFEEHIQTRKVDDEVEYDLAGNVIKTTSADEPHKRLYNLKYDGDYVFASFMQAYRIDLIEEIGKLHWKKFNALLVGLPEGTKFVEVLKIRSYEPQKGDSSEYIQKMRELQKEFRLPDEDIDDEAEEDSWD
ncbi:Gp15 family bacteriophage protein [Streptococcus cristatus]|uniref:Bacteriophage Gp15 protein n=1 Tax=Streptococcus cristatus TaxID=45634 RepID=A0A3R9KJ49_STRCR|nr:Gp15 family bacteriophage protein [Streptococcus cristatus]RSJ88325.1 Bacteriophage Gp15 protein [Streptococcus cristatus]